MEGAAANAIDTALLKAKSALRWRRPTSEMNKVVRSGQNLAPTFMHDFPQPGALPIVLDGEVIGSMGVSSADGEKCAQAAIHGVQKARDPARAVGQRRSSAPAGCLPHGAKPASRHARRAVGEPRTSVGRLPSRTRASWSRRCAALSLKPFSSSPRPARETVSRFTSRIGFTAVVDTSGAGMGEPIRLVRSRLVFRLSAR
jgi:Haem-degrading